MKRQLSVHAISKTPRDDFGDRGQTTVLKWCVRRGFYHPLESESRSVVSYSLKPHGLYCPWKSPSQNTGVGSLSLLQGIFPTQELNLGLLYCWWILYQLELPGKPSIVYCATASVSIHLYRLLGCFHVPAIVNSAAMNIGVHMSF